MDVTTALDVDNVVFVQSCCAHCALVPIGGAGRAIVSACEAFWPMSSSFFCA